MRRITVDFEDDIHLRLKIRCAQENVPISELIRRLVNEHLADIADNLTVKGGAE